MIPMTSLSCHSSDSRCCVHTLQPPPVQPGVTHTRSSSQGMQLAPSLCGLGMAMLDIGQRRWPIRGQPFNTNNLCRSSSSFSWLFQLRMCCWLGTCAASDVRAIGIFKTVMQSTRAFSLSKSPACGLVRHSFMHSFIDCTPSNPQMRCFAAEILWQPSSQPCLGVPSTM